MATVQIFVNQIGFDLHSPKSAVVEADSKVSEFSILDAASGASVFRGKLSGPQSLDEWAPGKLFFRADFSSFHQAGKYRISVDGVSSPAFEIGENELAAKTVPAIVNYYHKQRANTPQELEVDRRLILFGSDKTVDMHGGWCDASGDVSKYFSHLAYANFMCPQQTPMVVWSLANAADTFPDHDAIKQEAIWGADYMMRALSPEGYFYMIAFSYFNKDPNKRRVVGLHANSVTTDEYQCAFREGGGMAIAALARVSKWKQGGDFISEQYLEGAKRAFAHLLTNNPKYDDDGKENITDDYCALTAATELWIATDEPLYRDEARKRAGNLERRMSPAGYFIADDHDRPFWHAADAGLPIVSLCRYLDKERDSSYRTGALGTIKKALDYNLRITGETPNPFDYPRQSFKYASKVQDGFFIPHENETGWWWQGENARLGSLATAAIEGGRLVYPDRHGPWGVRKDLAEFAENQLSWVLGRNPFAMCFMYGFGEHNVPHMHSMFGHGSEVGGISNGITGKEGSGDGSGIDFKLEDNGNEWRWTEQWLPHAAWFLQAVTAMSRQ